MLKEYEYYGNRSNSLLAKLKKVNLYDPQTREADYWDDWFKKATPQLMHDGDCLAYINHYGHIENSFWLNIASLDLKPEQDKEFQQLIFSINKRWGCWTSNFCNLPYNYGKRYKLLPEIECILNTDDRFYRLKEAYEFARSHAEKERLEAF